MDASCHVLPRSIAYAAAPRQAATIPNAQTFFAPFAQQRKWNRCLREAFHNRLVNAAIALIGIEVKPDTVDGLAARKLRVES